MIRRQSNRIAHIDVLTKKANRPHKYTEKTRDDLNKLRTKDRNCVKKSHTVKEGSSQSYLLLLHLKLRDTSVQIS